MNHDDSRVQTGCAMHGRWARWAPRLVAVILAADCTGGAPPKPKADVAQARPGVSALPLAGSAVRVLPISTKLTSAAS